MRTNSRWLDVLRALNNRTQRRGLTRAVGINTYATLVRANLLLRPPRVLLVGPGKSGTHMASDLLSLFPHMMFSGRHFAIPFDATTEELVLTRPHTHRPIEGDAVWHYLRRCRQGAFITAHAPYHATLDAMRSDLGFKTILFMRDPRDVAVSYLRYVLTNPSHYQHRYLLDEYDDDHARLLAIIEGLGPRPSIGSVFRSYLPWMNAASVLMARYEDLVGPRGGGDAASQRDEILRIARHVNRDLSGEQAERIAQDMYSSKSMTFRSGRIGRWVEYFDDDHMEAFDRTAGEVLDVLGYR